MITKEIAVAAARPAVAVVWSICRRVWSLVMTGIDHERRSVVALSNVVLRSPTLWLACGTVVVGMFFVGFGAGVAGKGQLRARLLQAEITINGQEANLAAAETESRKSRALIAALKGQIEAMKAEADRQNTARGPTLAPRAPRAAKMPRRAPKVASGSSGTQKPSWVPWQ